MSATEDDRLTAVSLVPDHQDWCQSVNHGDCCGGECDCGITECRDAVAEALAAEREAARAPFLALADYWDTNEDARYSHNRIARSTAARAIRDAMKDIP